MKHDKVVQYKQIILKKSDIQKEEWDLVWEDEFNGDSIDQENGILSRVVTDMETMNGNTTPIERRTLEWKMDL